MATVASEQPTHAAPRTAPVSGSDVAVVVMAMVATATFAMRDIGRRSLWLDEGSTAYRTAGPLDRVVLALRREPQFGLYHLVVRATRFLGTSEAAFRVPSAVFAVLTIPALYFVARRLFGPTAATVSTLLLALNGYFLGYAQEARPYMFTVLTTTVAMLCLLRAIDASLDRRRWVAWGVSAVAAVLSHPFGAMVVVGQLVLLVFWQGSIPWRRIARAAAVPVIGVVVLGVILIRLGPGRLMWVRPVTQDKALDIAHELAGSRDGVPLLAYSLGAAVFVLALALLPRRRTALAFPSAVLFCWLLAPIVIAAAISTVQPLIVPRYLIVEIPAMVVLVGAGVAELPRLLAAIATVALILVAVPGAESPTRDSRPQDYRGVGALIAKEFEDGDVVIAIPFGKPVVQFYLEQHGHRDPPIPVVNPGALVRHDGAAYEACQLERVWIVMGRPGHKDDVARFLGPTHQLQQRWDFENLEVKLLERRPEEGC